MVNMQAKYPPICAPQGRSTAPVGGYRTGRSVVRVLILQKSGERVSAFGAVLGAALARIMKAPLRD